MKRWILVAGLLAAWFAPFAFAQQWAPYVPAERDFRVLMPAAPSRSVTWQGSVEFRAEVGRVEYFVYRHDPRRLADVSGPHEDIIKRITRGDETIRRLGEDGEMGAGEYMFKAGDVHTMHRVFTERGVYYELVVKATGDDTDVNRQQARDYFASFTVARGAAFVPTMAMPAPESCNTRASGVSRTLCQYVACIPAANAGHPVCTALPRFLR
jgi:hypothetical protein